MRLSLRLSLLLFAFLPLTLIAQTQLTHYSKNFILKGKITAGNNDTAFYNEPVNVFAFDSWRTVITGPNGEYEVNFADTASFQPSEYWAGNTTEILFGWGEDPNFTHTQSMKKLKLKKIKGKEKFNSPPKIIKLNFSLTFEFEE